MSKVESSGCCVHIIPWVVAGVADQLCVDGMCLFLPFIFLIIFLKMENENGFTLLVLFLHLNKNVLWCYKDYQNAVLLIMVSRMSVSLKMVSVAAMSKKNSMQISFVF